MASAAPSPRTRLSRADRMEQTLEVAHVLFAARGFAAVTMDDIAAEVGVTKPLLYNYFGNKERLYVACMERAGDALFATIEETVRPSANPGDAAQRRRCAPSSPSSTPTAPPGPSSSTRPCRRAGSSPTASPTTAAGSSTWSPNRSSPSFPRGAATPPAPRSRPSPPR